MSTFMDWLWDTATGFLGIAGVVELTIVLAFHALPSLRRRVDGMGAWTRWLLVGFGVGLIFFSSFHAYKEKADRLAAIENSIDGMLGVGGVEARKVGSRNPDVRIALENLSSAISLRFVPRQIVAAFDKVELPSVPYEVYPLVGPKQRRLIYYPIPEMLVMEPSEIHTLAIRIDGSYGAPSVNKTYPLCEIHYCDLNMLRIADQFNPLECRVTLCRQD